MSVLNGNQPPIGLGILTQALQDSLSNITSGKEAQEAWKELAKDVPGWIENHITAEHSIPSASTIDDCMLKTWYTATGKEPDSDIPIAWKRRNIVGILSELVWLAIFRLAKFKLEDLKDRYTFMDGIMYGRPDAIVTYNGSPRFVVELKERTGFEYKKYIQKYSGVIAISPNVYSQMQVYMEAVDVEWSLLLICPADYSMLQNTMRNNKKWGKAYELPAFHLEWVRKDPQHIEHLKERALKIKEAVETNEPPEREYNGIPIGFDGKKNWPCGYCIYNESCTTAYGYGDR